MASDMIRRLGRSSFMYLVQVTVIGILFSLFTLWLIQSWIRYPLFVFETVAIITLYVTLYHGDDYTNKKFNHLTTVAKSTAAIVIKVFQPINLNTLLVGLSLYLIVLSVFHIEGGIIQLCLAFLCVSILSGYALLRIFSLTGYFSRLEVVVLSYLLSFIFSGFSTLITLPLNENIRTTILPFFFLVVGIIASVRSAKETKISNNRINSLSKSIDIFPILLGIAFYAFFFSIAYPDITLIPGLDMSRHYSSSLILSRSPDIYTDFYYLLFHSFDASLHSLSGLQSLASFQSIQVILNIFLPISVYALSKRFLGDVDRRIPAVSTVFYSILSNFSFIYFAQLKLTGGNITEIGILANDVAQKAYLSNINFLQPFPWFVPLSVSFVMFIAALCLLRVHNIPKWRFIPLYTVLILAIYLTHVTEAIILVSFIGIYSFLSRSSTLRLDDAILASLISFLFALIFVFYTSFGWKSELMTVQSPLSASLPTILPILLLGTSLLWRRTMKFGNHISLKFTNHKFYYRISFLILAVYLFGYLTWVFVGNFDSSGLYELGIVPWFIYPVMLGIIGVLAILSIRYLGDFLPNSAILILVGSIIFMLFMGRIVSFLNVDLNIVVTGYWEKRFVLYIFLIASLLAPLCVCRFADDVKFRVRSLLAPTLSATVISLIIIAGFSSMVLQSEYWFSIAKATPSVITPKEFDAIDYLKNIFRHDTHAFVITPTTLSRQILSFAAPPYEFPLPEIFMASNYPDVPLLTLAAHNLNHAYIYMHNRDFEILSQYPHSWFAEHLLPMLPVVFSNGEVTIYNSSHVSYPSSESGTSLIIPTDSHLDRAGNWEYAYDIVSQSGKNYTVMYDQDPNAFRAKNMILSFDPTPINHERFYDNFLSDYKNNDQNRWNEVSGNWTYLSDGLHAGSESNTPSNVALSPISESGNSTIDALVKVNKANQEVPNYVSIVHSWIDPRNFEYAGVMIYNKAIYVYSASVSNGKLSFDPLWPGIRTNLQGKTHLELRMTLSIHNGKDTHDLELFLNGTKYLHLNHLSRAGYIGLSYGRLHDVTFQYFENLNMITSNVRKGSDYIGYANSGGHLIVINTNANGSIGNSLFDMSYNKFRKSVLLPDGSVAQIYTHWLRIPNISRSEVNITNSRVGLGTIIYVDMHQVPRDYFEKKISGKVMYETLRALSTVTNLKPLIPHPPNYRDISAIFRQASGSGKVLLNTSSVIFPDNMRFNDIKLTYGNTSISLKNVTSITSEGYRYVTLNTLHQLNFSLVGGHGLYSNLTLSDPTSLFNISFVSEQGFPTTMTVNSNGKEFHFSKVSNLTILNQEPVQIYARQPSLDIRNANVTFRELHSRQFYAAAQDLNYAGGLDLVALGNIHLSMVMSDSYSLANHISVDGSTSRISATPSYNELASLVPPFSLSKLYSLPIFVRVLLLIPLLIAAIFIIFIRPKKTI